MLLKTVLFAWLLDLSHQLKYAQHRPNQITLFNIYMQAHKMQVNLTAGVVDRITDEETGE